MSRRLVLHPLLDKDVDEISAWYENRLPGLGWRFTKQLDKCLSTIAERPESYSQVRGRKRRARINDFPYCVVFEIESNIILIYGAFHLARDRSAWDSRR